jgi:hypothetical protein
MESDKTPLYVSIILQSIVNFLIDKSSDRDVILQMLKTAIPDKNAVANTSVDNRTMTTGGSDMSKKDIQKYKDLIHAGLNLSGMKMSIPAEPKLQSLNKFVGFTEKKAKELCKAGSSSHLSEMIRRASIFLNVKDPSVNENRNLMNYMVDNECLPLSTNTFIDLFSASILRLYTNACKNTITNMNKLDGLVKEISKRPNTVEELNMLIELKNNISNLIVYETFPSVVLSYYKKRDSTNFIKVKEVMSTHNGINNMLASRCEIRGGAPPTSGISKMVGQFANNSSPSSESKDQVLKTVVSSVVDNFKSTPNKKTPPSPPLKVTPNMFGLYNIIDGLLTVLVNYSESVKPDSKTINKKV